MAAGFVSIVLDAIRRRPMRSLPAWAFGLLPLAAFTLQEFTERLLATHALPWWMFVQPTYRVGLLLQLPFALLAYVAARLLLRVGRTIGTIIATPLSPPAVGGARPSLRPGALVLPRLSMLQRGWSVRGPPAPSV